MTEDDIRIAMELFGGRGYDDPLRGFDKEVPKPRQKPRAGLDAARFPSVGLGTDTDSQLSALMAANERAAEDKAMSKAPLGEKIRGGLEGARLAMQAPVAGMVMPMAKVLGVPEDQFYKAAFDIPETEYGQIRGGRILQGAEDIFGAMSESPLRPFVEKLPFQPFSPASAKAIDLGIEGAGKGLKLARQEAKQAGKQILDEGQDLMQAARADVAGPPTGAIQLQAAQAPRSQLGMYSNAEQAILNLPQAKGTGNQLLAQISKTPGVKPAELEWTGLSDFLKGRGDKPVTKAEIEQYLQANKVQVAERQLLTPSEFQARINNEIMPGNESIWASVDPDGDITFKQMEPFSDRYLGEIRKDDLPDDIKSDLDDFLKSYGMAKYSPEDERYENYTTPGGSNYREILLKLPNVGENISFEKWVDKYTAIRSMEDLERDPRLMQQMRNQYQRDVSRIPKEGTFRSGHFDDPNIISHMRVTDRNDADGKKVLFVEELQSDWGRSGREYGFAEKPSAEVSEYKKLLKDYEQGTLPKDQTGRFEELYAKFGRDFVEKKDNRSPSAPFVQNTEDWLNLSLKRLITDAVNNGYDKVAFISGKQSADRYKMSKHVNTVLHTTPDEKGMVVIKALDKKDNQVLSGKYTLKQAEDILGKELTQKIQNPQGKKDPRTGTYSLSGVDLDVGGTGMKKFYDQIVPNTVNKLLKKLGGGKLDTVQLEDGMEQLGFTITPEMRELVKSQGLPMFAKGGAVTMKKGGVSSAMSGINAAKQASKAARRQQRVDKNLQRWSGSEEKPPVYYHATDAEKDFTVFDPTKSRSQAKAAFFTPKKEFASYWAERQKDSLENSPELKPRVMPSYLRVKNTFDFENPEHVESVVNRARIPKSMSPEYVARRIGDGAWPFIEDKNIQQAIKDSGFDSFFVKEAFSKNLGVFNPGDIKSVFNRGSYSEDPDISKAEGGAINGRARARAQAHLEATKAAGGAINGRARARAQAYKNGGAVELNLAPGGKVLKGAGAGIKAASEATAKKKREKEYPPSFPPAPSIPKEKIREMAQRIAEQTTGEFVRQNPKTTTNPENRSKVQFERAKAVKPAIRTNIKEPKTPVLDIEEFEDQLMVGVPGDPTLGGVLRPSTNLAVRPQATRELLGINDVEFEQPVGMYGGPRYGEESSFPKGRDPAYWASNISAARSLQNSLSDLSRAEGDRPVLGVFSKMATDSGNFALHTLDSLLAYQRPETLPKSKIKQLNKVIKEGYIKDGEPVKFPGFVGFENPIEVLNQANIDSELRKFLSATLQKPTISKEFKLRPGVDVNAALTNPEFLGQETGVSGFSVGRMVPGAELMEGSHPTYSHDIPGQFLGRLPYSIPYDLAFPRTAEFVRQNIPKGQLYNTMKSVGMKESIDPQYIDQIKLYQQYMKELTGRKKGGLATHKQSEVNHG